MIPQPVLLVAELGVRAPWNDVFFFMGLGFVLVMIVLTILSAAIAILGVFFRRFEGKPDAPKKSAHPAPAAQPDTAQSAPALIAVLAAAVHAVLDQPHRILSIQPAPAQQNWSIEGRRQIFSSHKVR